jgi:hypothetical protein
MIETFDKLISGILECSGLSLMICEDNRKMGLFSPALYNHPGGELARLAWPNMVNRYIRVLYRPVVWPHLIEYQRRHDSGEYAQSCITFDYRQDLY